MAGPGIHTYHQQWPNTTHVHPPILVDNPNRTTSDEVRTIFITGLPEDVKERELQNLLRWLPGYEASQINSKGEHPIGFALFSTAQFAVAAKTALKDIVFDAESKSVLHAEMAKKNLFVKRGIVADSSPFDQSKRMRTGGDYTHTGYSSPSHFHSHPIPVWAPHGYLAPPLPYNPYGAYAVPTVQMSAPTQVHVPVLAPNSYVTVPAPNNYVTVPAPSSYVPIQNTKDNPPCNTLFIGNLGENINEDELKGIFCVQPGYKQMKVLRQERHTVCFIEFDDVSGATHVHHSFQGAVIPSSGSVGMRIQFSKNPFGRRKDGSHATSVVPGAK